MKKSTYHIQIAALLFLLVITAAFAKKQTDPWRPDQLMAPKDLAAIINSSNDVKPLIINIGPVNSILGAVETGPANKAENLKALKKLLVDEKKDREIVIYCGCCPYNHCPNIRPAFSLLNSMKFTNHKLLDLPHNLKVDWIDQGYPLNK